MDTGSDFIRPEFLNILFFQQKNLVIFPYVDINHLHALEIFTAGHNIIDLETTALNNLKEVIESESSNIYAQNPNLFFITNAGRNQIQQIMRLDGIRCIINSNEIIKDLANGSKFVFFNKKHGQFINYNAKDEELDFEYKLISQSEDEECLQEQIQKIKIAASRIFRDLNQSNNLQNISQILKDYEEKYWSSILTFTGNYYDINIPEIKNLNLKSKPKKISKDFANEYEIIISSNKTIGKEFVQLLHDYRSRKVNAQNLEQYELYNPLRLYNYLRNHHWKEGVPTDFISSWSQMEFSGYTLTNSDLEDFQSIIEKLGIPLHSLTLPPSQTKHIIEEVSQVLDVSDSIPSVHTNWEDFKSWLSSQFDNFECLVSNFLNRAPNKLNNPKLAKITSIIFNDIISLNQLLKPYRNKQDKVIAIQKNNNKLKPKENVLLVDITNILNLDKNKKGEIKVDNIAKVHKAVLKIGYTPKMWADASMRYHVDNKMLYEELLKKKVIAQAPAGTKADLWILKIAEVRKCKFLSNDLYREYQKEFKEEWIFANRLTCAYDDYEGGIFLISENHDLVEKVKERWKQIGTVSNNEKTLK